MLTQTQIEQIARAAHEVNRSYCKILGDDSQSSWDEAPDWQKDSARNGVIFHLSGTHSPNESHENWYAQKEAEGWIYGPVKDPVKKEHPCMVPYQQLPVAQRMKDSLFISTVRSLELAIERIQPN